MRSKPANAETCHVSDWQSYRQKQALLPRWALRLPSPKLFNPYLVCDAVWEAWQYCDCLLFNLHLFLKGAEALGGRVRAKAKAIQLLQGRKLPQPSSRHPSLNIIHSQLPELVSCASEPQSPSLAVHRLKDVRLSICTNAGTRPPCRD